jgi:Phage terminase, small subunit
MPRPNPLLVPKDKDKKPRLIVNKKGLTPKQALFVKAYVSNGHNGTQAAITAGYSKKCAQEIASENLSKPLIAQEKDRLMSKLADSVGLSAEYILKRLKEVTYLDAEENGVTVMKALELAGKHHSLFTEKSEVTVKGHEDWLENIKDE